MSRLLWATLVKKNFIQIENSVKKCSKNQALSCRFLEGRQALLPHFQ